MTEGASAVPLRVSVTDADGHTVVEVAGELDIGTRWVFDETLEALLGADRRIVIDLRKTTFIGSTGLNAILGAHHALAANGRIVSVLVDRPLHRRLFEITGLDAIVRLEDGT